VVEDDAANGADPAYAAVTFCVPAEVHATTHVAVPALSVREPPEQLRAAPPLLKTTVPFGVPDSAVTLAVYVTGCPTTDGLADEVSEVVVGTLVRTDTVALGALAVDQPERTDETMYR